VDNSSSRRVDVFFYGLYMDDSILKNLGVVVSHKKPVYVEGYRLRIGKNATLLREENSRAYGVVCSLSHSDIHRLYAARGLANYVPEAITVRTSEGRGFAAICYVLLTPPHEDEINSDYYQTLVSCMKVYGLPIPASV